MTKKTHWIGKEVEGRLYGLETLCIANSFTDFEKEFDKTHHVLIGTPLIEEMAEAADGNKINWSWLEDRVDSRKNFLSLEVKPGQLKKIPHSMKLKCHILYWIDAEELQELKSSDSVKLSIRGHDMFVFTLFNGQRVTRNDYYHDRY